MAQAGCEGSRPWLNPPLCDGRVFPWTSPLPVLPLSVCPVSYSLRSCPRLCTDNSHYCDFPSGTTVFCNGLWVTSGGDFRWSRGNGSHINGTGPAAGPSGRSYAYIFAGGYTRVGFAVFAANRPHKTAHLTSAASDYVGVSFWYHMYGADMGTFAVEVQVWQHLLSTGSRRCFSQDQTCAQSRPGA